MTDALKQFFHDTRSAFIWPEIRHRAATSLGHVVEEITIYRAANAKAENARVAEPLMDFAKDFGFIADVAVRQETNESLPFRIVREIHGCFDAVHHHGAALGIERVQIIEAALHVFGSGFDWRRSQL